LGLIKMFSKSDLDFAAKKLTSSTPTSLAGVLGILVGKNPKLRDLTEQDLVDALQRHEDEKGLAQGGSPSLDKLQRELSERRQDVILSRLLQAISEIKISEKVVDDYMILSHKTQAGLTMEVQKWIKMRWQPFGAPGAAAFGISPVGGNQYFQAVVKYK
jgi:hypothetical protein